MSPSYFLPVNSLTISNRIVAGSLSRTRVRADASDPPSTKGQPPHPSHHHAGSRPDAQRYGEHWGHRLSRRWSSSRPLWRWLPHLSLALFAALAASGCKPQGQSQPPSVPPVTVAKPVQKEIVEWDEYTGRTEAVESVDVRPRVSGYIDRIGFEDGQLVHVRAD